MPGEQRGRMRSHWAKLRIILLFITVARRESGRKRKEEEEELKEEEVTALYLGIHQIHIYIAGVSELVSFRSDLWGNLDREGSW